MVTDNERILIDARAFISSQLDIPADNVATAQDLKSIGLDSFRIIELVLFLERRTGISFPDSAYTPANLKSLDSIVGCFLNLKR